MSILQSKTLRTTHWASFESIVADLEDTYRYVEPTTENMSTYSIRYYELLLRACTEFESVCKSELVKNGWHSNPQNITHYYILESQLNCARFEVGYYLSPIFYCDPLAEWKTSHQLSWYQDYNLVKHNRIAEFKRASLKNAFLAIGGLFLIMAQSNLIPWSGKVFNKFDGTVITVSDHIPLLMKTTFEQQYGWPMKEEEKEAARKREKDEYPEWLRS